MSSGKKQAKPVPLVKESGKALSQSPQKLALDNPNSLKPGSKPPGSKPITPAKELNDHKPNPSHKANFSADHSSVKHHSPMEELDLKIKARKRILETLEGQSPSINDEMLLQLSSRDSVIEELNKENTLLKVKIKEIKKDAMTAVENDKTDAKRIEELENEKVHLEGKMAVMVDKFRNEIMKIEEEKAGVEVVQEAMAEEIEVLKAQVKNKDEEIKGVVADIRKLSEIIQQFKTLNHDLNQKIENQTQEYETMHVKYYESEVKAANIAEVESNLQDYIRIYQQSEHKVNTISEELRKFQILYEDLQAFTKNSENQLEAVLKDFNEETGKPILKHLRSEMEKRRSVDIPESDEHPKDAKIRDLSEKLSRVSLELSQIENSQRPLHDQVTASKELLSTVKKGHLVSIESLNKTIASLQDLSESLKLEVQNLRTENGKKEVKVSALSSKLSSTEGKLSSLQDKLKKIKEANLILEKELADFKQRNSQLRGIINEKTSQINIIERQNSKYVINIQTLHEEFWKKDTAIIKLKKTITQLQKAMNESLSMKEKAGNSRGNENYEKLLKELHEKDQKIEILKDMVKSSQLKVKDKKSEGVAEIGVHELHNEKAKVSNELVNSLAAKTINKFFTICNFHRSAPQDSPPDMQRLLKKLRQDLKSYSVFSVKDLQNSVSQLQFAHFDNKSHISLDELIVSISRAVNS